MFLLALDESLLVLRGSRMPSTRELRRRQPKRMQQLAAKFLSTMKDYPPSQTPGSFNLTKVEAQIKAAMGGH